tara:strand:- start:35936 stop:36277 length:342 start_codon:yes stop_codon:yes gene_type:complete
MPLLGLCQVCCTARHVLENPFNQALSESLRKYYQTDIAITPGFRFDAVLQQGDTMTVEDSYRYLPVPPVLARGVIAGKSVGVRPRNTAYAKFSFAELPEIGSTYESNFYYGEE